jgi:hypothetical protein
VLPAILLLLPPGLPASTVGLGPSSPPQCLILLPSSYISHVTPSITHRSTQSWTFRGI